MRPKIAIVYNEPLLGRYGALGEKAAVLGIMEEVEAVHRVLADLGYPLLELPLMPPLEQAREKLKNLNADLVFNLFEGFDGCPGTESEVACLMSELELTHTGSPGAALSAALDKERFKTLLNEAGISTPRCQLLDRDSLEEFHLSYPCIVKPCAEDASHGISEDSVVSQLSSLEKQVAWVSDSFGGKALVEEYVDGREFNATVLGNKNPDVLPISEIVYSLPPGMPRILTFSAKWNQESIYFRSTTPACPAEIAPDLRNRIVETAVTVFRLLGCSGYARVDFRLDSQGKPLVLEANPNCDISPSSGAARQALAGGMTYSQFIEKIVLLALERKQPS